MSHITLEQPARPALSGAGPGLTLWLRWAGANGLGEMLGLGLTMGIAALAWPSLETGPGTLAGLAAMVAVVLAGALVEGLTVGTAQWAVLRAHLTGLRWPVWAGMTALGAGVAWALGLVPMAILNAQASAPYATDAPPAEMSATLTYLLAAGMGFGLGVFLGTAQWLVLKRHVRRAAWWIPANCLAWAAGMPLTFVGADLAFASREPAMAVLLLGLSLLATGLVVGAVHGAVLVWLLRQKRVAATGLT